ncbi:MBL fold metallo-hydrolase, partial [Pseudomonas aeruginosa]
MLVFESIYTEGLAQISYLVGDSKAAVAAVIDPRRDVEVYLDLARDKGLRIAYAIETHIHADFVSGAQALAERCGAEIIGGLRLRAASGGRRRGAGTGSGQPGSAAL